MVQVLVLIAEKTHTKALLSCIARSAYRVLTSSFTRSDSGRPGGKHFLQAQQKRR